MCLCVSVSVCVCVCECKCVCAFVFACVSVSLCVYRHPKSPDRVSVQMPVTNLATSTVFLPYCQPHLTSPQPQAMDFLIASNVLSCSGANMNSA